MHLGGYILKWMGWKVVGQFPTAKKFVVVSAPHTSMWDFVIGRLFLYQYPIQPKFLIKKELFIFPFGYVMKWMGGIPVDRSKKTDIIERIIENYRQSDEMVLAITPEGTRKNVNDWKTGFYYISKGAGVPILPSYFDYKNKEIGIGELFYPSDDLQNDINKIKEFVKVAGPKHPERYTHV